MLSSFFSRVFLLALFAVIAAMPVRAEPSLVFDVKTGEVILSEKAGEPWHPASLTKLMTTYLVFRAVKAGRLRLDQKIVMSKRAAKEPPSKIGYKPGTRFSVDFAVKFLLVRSGNDIAVALGEAVSGNVDAFVTLMNTTSRRLGMTGTNFTNPHGLHNQKQVTTARDMGLLAATLYHEFPQYRAFYGLQHVKVGKRNLKNRNSLLRTMKGANGMKTGFICPAGFNLVASATRNGRTLVAVVLGRRSGYSRTRYTQLLLEAAFRTSGSGFNKTRLASIANHRGTPENMRAKVCKGLGVRYAKAEELGGWGVSLGRLKRAADAYAVLDGQMLLARSYAKAGGSGIMRVPFEKDYIALLWSMGQSNAKRLCEYLGRLNSHCEVVAPATFSDLSRRAIEYRAAVAKKQAQRKSKRKKKRSKKRRRKKPVR